MPPDIIICGVISLLLFIIKVKGSELLSVIINPELAHVERTGKKTLNIINFCF